MSSGRKALAIAVVVHGVLAVGAFYIYLQDEARAARQPLVVRLQKPAPLETAPRARAPAVQPRTSQPKTPRAKRTEPPRPAPPRSEPERPAIEPPHAEAPAPAVDPTRPDLDLNPKLIPPPLDAPNILDFEPPRLAEKNKRRRPTKGGGFRFEDEEFNASVNYDGTVEIDDLTLWERLKKSEIGVTDGTLDGEPGSPTRATLDAPRTKDRGRSGAMLPLRPQLGLSIPMDVTDMIMRTIGDDPYAYEKLRFLERTRDERIAMAKVACGEHLSHALIDLPDRLKAVRRSSRSVQAQRRVLFEMWDECIEDGDPQRIRFANMVRVTIIEFINKHYAAGSGLAYRDAELDALNSARDSRRRFNPYPRRARKPELDLADPTKPL